MEPLKSCVIQPASLVSRTLDFVSIMASMDMPTLQQAAHALMEQHMQGIREELSMQQQRYIEEQRQTTQAALQQQLESLAAAGARAATQPERASRECGCCSRPTPRISEATEVEGTAHRPSESPRC